jgi:hypothetical protein
LVASRLKVFVRHWGEKVFPLETTICLQKSFPKNIWSSKKRGSPPLRHSGLGVARRAKLDLASQQILCLPQVESSLAAGLSFFPKKVSSAHEPRGLLFAIALEEGLRRKRKRRHPVKSDDASLCSQKETFKLSPRASLTGVRVIVAAC